MKTGEKTVRFEFPFRGVDISVSENDLDTTVAPDLMNVRPYDFKDRQRGGSRPPLRRLIPDGVTGNPSARSQPAGTVIEQPVQALVELSGVEFTGLNETESTNKAITIVYVVGGELYRMDWDDQAQTRTTTQIGTVAGPTANVTLAADGPIVYVMSDDVTPAYTDASTQTVFHKYYNALDDTLNNWVLDTHALDDPDSLSYPNVPLVDPNEAYSSDGNGDDARTLVTAGSYKGFFPTSPTKIVAKWGRRVVLAGIEGDEQNIICSRKGDGDDFDWRPLMVEKYLEENLQITTNNADYVEQVAAYNARLSAVIGPEPNTFTYTTFSREGAVIKIACTNATGNSFNEKVARSVCQQNTNNLNAAIANTTVDYTAPNSYAEPADSMRSYALEQRSVDEYTKDTYPVRYTETEDPVELADMAWSARHSETGLVPDEIVNVIPYDESILLILCKSSVWELNGGENLSQAKLRPVTRIVGGTEGSSWVIDPIGDVYFVGSDKGIYKLVLQQGPSRIDMNIEHLTDKFDRDTGRWTMIYDEKEGGIYLHGWDSSNHINLFYSLRTQGWFVDYFASDLASQVMCGIALNPRDGDVKDGRRVAVWGSKDGELYYLDTSYPEDYRDQITYTASPNLQQIESFVFLGPFNESNGEDLMLKSLDISLDDGSSAIIWEGYAADTASQASSGSPKISGSVEFKDVYTSRQRMSGNSLYLKVISHPNHNLPWALDTLEASAEVRTKLKRRT
jgi:hypothetical protein